MHSIKTELQILATKKGKKKGENVSANETRPGVWVGVEYC